MNSQCSQLRSHDLDIYVVANQDGEQRVLKLHRFVPSLEEEVMLKFL